MKLPCTLAYISSEANQSRRYQRRTFHSIFFLLRHGFSPVGCDRFRSEIRGFPVAFTLISARSVRAFRSTTRRGRELQLGASHGAATENDREERFLARAIARPTPRCNSFSFPTGSNDREATVVQCHTSDGSSTGTIIHARDLRRDRSPWSLLSLSLSLRERKREREGEPDGRRSPLFLSVARARCDSDNGTTW